METKIIIIISLFILLVVAVVIIIRKKDNYQYPAGVTYSSSGSWSNVPGKANDITQPVFSKSLVTDNSGNISTSYAVPIGGIIMWAGSIATIPEGWGICDGSSYTNTTTGNVIVSPDLRSRFVVGAANNANKMTQYTSTYGAGDTGGEEYHQLSIPEMPSHAHGINADDAVGGGQGTGNDWGVSWQNTGFTGGDPNNNNETLPHNNMPPYYALAFIMKYD